MSNNLVAINVLTDKILLNNKNVPILFYWDGKSDVLNQIKNNSEFIKWLEKMSVFSSIHNFMNTEISYFYFSDIDTEANGNENYADNSIMTNEVFDISITKDNPIKEVFNYMYSCVFHVDYSFSENENYQANIYNMIHNKYKDKITKETFINAIRNYLQNVIHADEKISNYIISNITI